MNERIKELAKQAGFNQYINENLWPQEHPEFNDLMEKFAELIVRECSDLFEVEYGDEKLSGNDVGYVLKKHFGVE